MLPLKTDIISFEPISKTLTSKSFHELRIKLVWIDIYMDLVVRYSIPETLDLHGAQRSDDVLVVVEYPDS